MMYFFLWTKEAAGSGLAAETSVNAISTNHRRAPVPRRPPVRWRGVRTEAGPALHLFQRIDLAVQACYVDRVAREHRNRLDRAAQPCPPDLSACSNVESRSSTRLDANNSLAENGRRGDHITGSSFPPELAGRDIQRIQVALFAPDHHKITQHCRRRRDSQAGFIFPADSSGIRIHGINVEVFRPDHNRIADYGWRRVDTVTSGGAPQNFAG